MPSPKASDAEALPAPALVLDVGVSELKALTESVAGKIDFRPVHQGKALGIDDNLYTIAIVDVVFAVDGIGKVDDIGKTGATCLGDAKAQPYGVPPVLEKLLDTARRGVGKCNGHGVRTPSATPVGVGWVLVARPLARNVPLGGQRPRARAGVRQAAPSLCR